MAQQTTSTNNQNQTVPEHFNSHPPSNNLVDLPIRGNNQSSMHEYQNSNPIKMDTLEFTNKPQKEIEQLQRGRNNPNVFDEKPIGKSDFNLSEFPSGGQVVEINYTMIQKLKSKAAKMRLSGMQDLLELLQNNSNSSEIDQIQIVALLKQTTPANIEKIIQCLKLWVQKNKEWGEDEAKMAIENGYINGKTNSKKFTIETIDLMYQQKPALIQMVIVAGLKNKTPKIIAGYNGMLNQLLAIYGIKRMNYLKPYLSEIVRVTSTEKLVAVKIEGVNTFKQAYKWLGKQVVEPMLGNLKQNIKKQIDSFWETYDKTIIMSAPKDIKQETFGRGRGKKIDAYDLSQAVDVFKKFDQKWAQSILNAEKWNQKTRLMQEFVKATAVPKFANTDFRHVSQVIRRQLNDNNFNVVLWDLKMIAAMSKGLRKYFMPVAKSLFSSIISKFREKKTLMVEQTFKTLNELNYCLALEDVLESVKEGLNDKVPNMKCNLLDWITKHVQKKTEEKGGECPQKTEDAIKQLLPTFQKLTGDGVAEVRESMTKNLVKMELLLGEDFFSSIKAKFNKSAVLKNTDVKGNDNTVASASRNNSKSKESKTPQKGKKNSSLQKNEVSVESKALQKSPHKKITEINIIKAGQFESLLLCFQQPSYQQSLQILKGFGFPQGQIDNITSLGTKERGNVLQFFRQNPYQNFNAILRVLRRVFKEWKEVNVMMNKDLISYLEERQTEIGKQQLYVILPFIVDKIGDSKFSQSLYRIITNICCRVSGRYIVGLIIKYSSEGKKPKLIGDACNLLVHIINSISLVNCPLRSLVEYAQSAYLNLMVECRKNAIQLLNCLYSYKGNSLKSMLDQITVRQMESEFKNIQVLQEYEKKPKIQLEGEAILEYRDFQKYVSKTESKTCDLSSQVQQLIPKMNDSTNWQNRKLAAQSLIKLIEQGDNVTFGNITDLLATVKTHINDSNKQLIKIFVHLAGLILCALSEKQAKSHIRPIMTVLIQGFNDKNEQNRKQTHLTINKIAANIGKDYILSFLGHFLEGDRDSRLEVLTLIMSNEQAIQKADVKGYSKGLVSCLCDKNRQIRSLAQKVFEKVYKQLGIQIFRSIAKDQKTAVAKDINLFLDKFDRSSSLSCRTPKRNSVNKVVQNVNSSSRSKSKLIVQPPISNNKHFLQKNNPQKSFMICDDEDLHATASMSYLPRQLKTLVQGNQIFADIKILKRERVQRQSLDQSYIWRFDEIKQLQEQTLRQCIQRLIRADIAKSLFCLEYKRVLEGFTQLIKLCKEISNHAPIRQIYDLLFKTLLLRLWGGHPDLQGIIELLPHIMSILQKKGIAMGDNEVELVVTILREYLISVSMGGCKVSQNLPLILTNLIALSSGQRVLKNILRQFCLNLTKIHKHLKGQSCLFYRQYMKKLIKTKLMDCMGSSDILQQTSKIKELREDQQFVETLYKKIHKSVLDNFGFKILQQREEQSVNAIKNISIAQISNYRNTTTPRHQNQSRDKISEGLPPKGRTTSKTVTQLNKLVLSSSPGRKLNFPQQLQIPSVSSFQLPPASPSNSVQSYFNQTISQYSNIEPIVPCNSLTINEFTNFNLSIPTPVPPGPFGKYLAQLFPPSDVAINYFNSIFTQSADKMSKELAENAKTILASILKSIHKCFQSRNEMDPDRIISQILLLQNCIRCSHIIKNIGDLLEDATLFALHQLVYEDENKTVILEKLQLRNIQFKSDGFIKAINGVMLRLLENANSQDNVNVFLRILTVQYTNHTMPSPKLISLLVKCFGRVSANYAQQLRSEQAQLFIIRAISYLSVIHLDTALQKLQIKKEGSGQRLKPNYVVANSIKSIIDQLCKAVGSEIWQYYEAAKSQFQYPDNYIASYISFMNIKPVQKKARSSSKNKQNEELRKICQLLSKTKSYEIGIIQLKKYINLHAEFRPLEYFTSLNYDQKFILMVIRSIDETNQPKQTSWKDKDIIQQANHNIQDKLKKLKQKFQQSQVKQQRSQDSLLAKDKQLPKDRQKDERAEQIRRRIEEMKSRMSSPVNRSKS